MTYITRFMKGQDGATAVEYAVMLALIIVVCMTGINAIGSSNNGLWAGNNNAMQAAGFGS